MADRRVAELGRLLEAQGQGGGGHLGPQLGQEGLGLAGEELLYLFDVLGVGLLR